MFIPSISKSADKDNTFEAETMDYDIGENGFVSFCSKFCYLGSTITSKLDGTADIKSRINKARGLFMQMRPVFKASFVPKKL